MRATIVLFLNKNEKQKVATVYWAAGKKGGDTVVYTGKDLPRQGERSKGRDIGGKQIVEGNREDKGERDVQGYK